MATIRMALSAGAALIALMAIVPATSQAQAPKAPLQLVPGADQARKSTRAATTKKATKAVATTSSKATRTAASNKRIAASNKRAAASNKKASRQNTAAARPPSKTARTNSRKTANSVASRRQGQTATNAQRARAATGQRATRTVAAAPKVAASKVAVSRPILRRAAPVPQAFAQAPVNQAPADHIMRGGDSVSLIAMLPWWRNDRLQAVSYGSTEAESTVMAAADAWLAANGGNADNAPGETFALASADEAIDVSDAGQVNDIDLAAASVPMPPTPTFLQSLLALLGGAAVAAAASARLLFV